MLFNNYIKESDDMETNDIVYGLHAVTESLQANTGNKLYIQEDLRGKNVDKIKLLAKEKKEAAGHFANLYVGGTYPEAVKFFAKQCPFLTMGLIQYVKSIR